MPDAPFTTLPVDLSKQGAFPLVVAGPACYSLTVFQIPAGVQLVAKDGAGNLFPLYFATQTVEFCPPVMSGVQLLVPAGLSGTLLVGINGKQYGTVPPTQSAAPATFLGGATFATAGNAAGQGSVLQLQNPAASTKLLSVRAAGGASSVATLGAIYKINTLRATAPSSSFITASAPGMPNAVGMFKAANAIAFAGGVTPAGFAQHIGGSGTRAVLEPLTQPLIVQPGWACEMAGSLGTNGESLLLSVAWDEF